MGFDQIVAMIRQGYKELAEKEVADLNLDELGEVAREGTRIYPWLTEENPKIETKERLEIACAMGLVLHTAKQHFE